MYSEETTYIVYLGKITLYKIKNIFMKFDLLFTSGEAKNTLMKLGLVLWHINHCGLFNAKSFFYIYIKYIGFSLFGFYGISTIVG